MMVRFSDPEDLRRAIVPPWLLIGSDGSFGMVTIVKRCRRYRQTSTKPGKYREIDADSLSQSDGLPLSGASRTFKKRGT